MKVNLASVRMFIWAVSVVTTVLSQYQPPWWLHAGITALLFGHALVDYLESLES